MPTVLICNVGTREVQLADPTVLPPEVRSDQGTPLARLAGAYLRDPAVFARLKDHIRESAFTAITADLKPDSQFSGAY